MDWWNSHETLGWVLVAAALGVIEVATLEFVFLMLAGGALVAALATALPFDLPFLGQVVVAVVASVGMIVFVRPIALSHLHRSTRETRTGVQALVGREALVLEAVDGHQGRIKLAGEVWSARSYDPHLVLQPGSTVDVLEIDGATAVVHATHL